MEFGLEDGVVDKITGVFEMFNEVHKVIIYGSRAKGNFKNGSDVDIALIGDRLNLTVKNKICLELDNLLLPYTIDVSLLEQITNPDLLAHINRVGIVFYEKST